MKKNVTIRILTLMMASSLVPATFAPPTMVLADEMEYQEDDRLDTESWGFFDDILIVKNNIGLSNYIKNGKSLWNKSLLHLSFEKDVAGVDLSQFPKDSILSITFDNPNPPMLYGESLSNFSSLLSIYIPEHTMDAYKKAWGDSLAEKMSEITAEDVSGGEEVIGEEIDVSNTPVTPVPETPAETPVPKEEPTYTVSNKELTVTGVPKEESVKIGTKKTIGKGVYQVIGKGKVAFLRPRKKTYKTMAIPKTVKISGKKYKVIQIAKNAFKNNKKLTSVTVPNTVTHIGARAFYGTKKLKKVRILSKNIKSIGKNAFGKTKNVKVYVPKKQKKKYQKMLIKQGVKKKNVRPF